MDDNAPYQSPAVDINAENRFWLRILHEHTLLMMDTLVPRETALLNQTQQFSQVFGNLLQTVESGQDGRVNQEAAQATQQFQCFQLDIVNRQLAGQTPINLPPGALNEMLDEDDEYLRVLGVLPQEQPMNEAVYLLHQHMMWLSNNAAHAALIRSLLDPSEAVLFKQYNKFFHLFQNLFGKTMEIKGLMRGNPRMVPALVYLTRESAAATQEFRSAVACLRELRITAQVLAVIPPALAEHFELEAAYYLQKIGYRA